MGDEVSDEVLMDRIKRNELGAFEVLYQRHAMRLWRYYNKRNPERADDLFQECFARLLERREQWKGGPFLPWLFVMARHLWIDDWRKERKYTADALAERASVPTIEIEEWLEGLAPELKNLMKEHYLVGLSYAELANKYHTQEANLRQKLSRALRSLRQEIV